MEKRSKIKVLTECAIMVALATVLSYIKLYEAPLGGSVTLLSMLPIILVSFRWGIKAGLGTAYVYSTIQLMQGIAYVTAIPSYLSETHSTFVVIIAIIGSTLFDYILPFTALGLAGMFYNKSQTIKRALISIVLGTLTVLILRFACHVFIGGVLWHEVGLMFAEEGDWILSAGPWAYSLVYNIQYMGPEAAITLAATPLIFKLKDLLK